jgi:hypothetical protein
MYQRNAVPPSFERRPRRIRTGFEFHPSGIGLERAGDDIHQRTLARAVLADERVDLAGY